MTNRKHDVGDERGGTPSVSGERDRRQDAAAPPAEPVAWRWRRNQEGALWSQWRGMDDGSTSISLEQVAAGPNVVEYAYAAPAASTAQPVEIPFAAANAVAEALRAREAEKFALAALEACQERYRVAAEKLLRYEASTAQTPVALLRELREELALRSLMDDPLAPLLAKLDAALASPAPGSAPAGWQPIASAPRDKTRIVLAHFSGNYACYSTGYWMPLTGWRGWFDSEPNQAAPTHWMPLPAAPDSSAATTPDKPTG